MQEMIKSESVHNVGLQEDSQCPAWVSRFSNKLATVGCWDGLHRARKIKLQSTDEKGQNRQRKSWMWFRSFTLKQSEESKTQASIGSVPSLRRNETSQVKDTEDGLALHSRKPCELQTYFHKQTLFISFIKLTVCVIQSNHLIHFTTNICYHDITFVTKCKNSI